MLREDGLRAHLKSLGYDCSDIDIVNAGIDKFETERIHDLSKASVWDWIHKDLRAGEYAAIVMGTPCETASRARTGPPGPRPLRSA